MLRLVCTVMVLLGVMHMPAQADTYPSRPITIIVGLAAGGVSDVMTRVYAASVSKALGQNIVVENRPTGSGAVAASTLLAAEPNGYMLLVFPISQYASVPIMNANVGYDPLKGPQAVTLLFSIATLVAVPGNSPFKTLEDLTKASQARAGGVDVGSPGLGTPAHLSGAKLMNVTKTHVQFVHYRGAAPMMTDLISARLDAAMVSSLTAGPFLRDGKIRALSSDASEKWAAAPDVPLLKDLGLEQAGLASWFGLAAPPGTPKAIVDKLNAAFVAASKDPMVRKTIEDSGLTVVTSTPDEMQAIMARDTKDVIELVRGLGLTHK